MGGFREGSHIVFDRVLRRLNPALDVIALIN